MPDTYSKLFEPIDIGPLHLRNRICMAPMHTKYASESGEVSQKLIDYFVERAKGGVGLIVVENTCVDWETGKGDGNPVTIHDDRFRPALHELVKSVHRWGAKIIPELHHVGRQTFKSNLNGRSPLSASAIQSEVGGDMPRAMSEVEIWQAVDNFRNAARRAKEAGFDGVELHGAHGYLFNCFLSPRTNHRTDKWGGSFENRSRFAVETVRAVREAIGPDFPLFFRMSAAESTEGGLTLEEGLRYAKLLESEGVDCLDITHGTYESIKHFPMQGDPLDQLVYLAEAVKKAVSIPVIAVGSLGIDPAVAERVLAEGKADMIHFGRELLAEPRLVEKIRDGRFDEARKCIRCNECTGSIDKGHYLACAVNPECGYEYKHATPPNLKGRRVVVVGAGPAGLEYAVTAAAGGAEVHLLEKQADIGGLAGVCSRNDYKNPEICRLVDYYRVMLEKRGVELHLGVEADAEAVMEYSPDNVVLAMGSDPMELPVAGSEKMQIAIDKLLDGGAGLGKRVSVVGGSGVGLDVAIYLAQRDHEVTVLEMTDSIAGELSGHLRWHLLEMAEAAGVSILKGHAVREVTDTGVVVEHDGRRFELACDNTLSAVGFRRVATAPLIDQLSRQGVAAEVLGDMAGAGHFMDAIHSAFWQAVEA